MMQRAKLVIFCCCFFTFQVKVWHYRAAFACKCACTTRQRLAAREQVSFIKLTAILKPRMLYGAFRCVNINELFSEIRREKHLWMEQALFDVSDSSIYSTCPFGVFMYFTQSTLLAHCGNTCTCACVSKALEEDGWTVRPTVHVITVSVRATVPNRNEKFVLKSLNRNYIEPSAKDTPICPTACGRDMPA
jgi:hypothetical protein